MAIRNMTGINRRDALRMLGTGVGSLAAAISCSPRGSVSGTGGAASDSNPTPAAMLTKRIPSSNEAIPVIGLGTWQTFDVGASSSERQPLEEVLAAFSSMGGRLIDSSPMYGNSEEVAGDISAKLSLRQKLFVATKVWTSGKAAGVKQMEDSMRKLRADPIDLMQVHNLVDVGTHLDTLAEWKRKGRVRYVGVTHYTASSHDAVADVISSRPVDFIQINYSVGEREAEGRLLPLAMERGVAVIANRPFAGGDLFSRLRSKPLPAWAAEIDCESWAQILLKFVISHPAVTCAIPATSKVTHLRDNMKAGQGRLPDKELRARIASELAG
ncbi:MAG TPA: aldo/keto reductase [Pyrinomonadaceae bacterium]|nr:aldo/keto reductase [Pyrinomonadaceae bacterium]